MATTLRQIFSQNLPDFSKRSEEEKIGIIKSYNKPGKMEEFFQNTFPDYADLTSAERKELKKGIFQEESKYREAMRNIEAPGIEPPPNPYEEFMQGKEGGEEALARVQTLPFMAGSAMEDWISGTAKLPTGVLSQGLGMAGATETAKKVRDLGDEYLKPENLPGYMGAPTAGGLEPGEGDWKEQARNILSKGLYGATTVIPDLYLLSMMPQNWGKLPAGLLFGSKFAPEMTKKLEENKAALADNLGISGYKTLEDMAPYWLGGMTGTVHGALMSVLGPGPAAAKMAEKAGLAEMETLGAELAKSRIPTILKEIGKGIAKPAAEFPLLHWINKLGIELPMESLLSERAYFENLPDYLPGGKQFGPMMKESAVSAVTGGLIGGIPRATKTLSIDNVVKENLMGLHEAIMNKAKADLEIGIPKDEIIRKITTTINSPALGGPLKGALKQMLAADKLNIQLQDMIDQQKGALSNQPNSQAGGAPIEQPPPLLPFPPEKPPQGQPGQKEIAIFGIPEREVISSLSGIKNPSIRQKIIGRLRTGMGAGADPEELLNGMMKKTQSESVKTSLGLILEKVKTGAIKPAPKPTDLSWITEAQKNAGWDPKWPFVPADFANKNFRDAILFDPELSENEKLAMFTAAKKLGAGEIPNELIKQENKPPELLPFPPEKKSYELTDQEFENVRLKGSDFQGKTEDQQKQILEDKFPILKLSDEDFEKMQNGEIPETPEFRAMLTEDGEFNSLIPDIQRAIVEGDIALADSLLKEYQEKIRTESARMDAEAGTKVPEKFLPGTELSEEVKTKKEKEESHQTKKDNFVNYLESLSSVIALREEAEKQGGVTYSDKDTAEILRKKIIDARFPADMSGPIKSAKTFIPGAIWIDEKKFPLLAGFQAKYGFDAMAKLMDIFPGKLQAESELGKTKIKDILDLIKQPQRVTPLDPMRAGGFAPIPVPAPPPAPSPSKAKPVSPPPAPLPPPKTTPVPQTIEIIKGPKGWLAKFSDPDVIKQLGHDTAPTAFALSKDIQEVIKEIQAKNPNAKVFFNGPTITTAVIPPSPPPPKAKPAKPTTSKEIPEILKLSGGKSFIDMDLQEFMGIYQKKKGVLAKAIFGPKPLKGIPPETLFEELKNTEQEQWDEIELKQKKVVPAPATPPVPTKAPLLPSGKTPVVGRESTTSTPDKNTKLKTTMMVVPLDDAKFLDEGLMKKFRPGANGEIISHSNKDFLSEFMKRAIPVSEQAKYRGDKSGNFTTLLETRIRNALFARVFGDSEKARNVLELMAADPDNDIRNITKALALASPRLASLKDKMESGKLNKADIFTDIVDAADELQRIRKEGITVDDFLHQKVLPSMDEISPFQKEILKFLNEFKLKPNKMRDVFEEFSSIVEKMGSPGQKDLFGNSSSRPKEEIFAEALAKIRSGNQPGFPGVNEPESEWLSEEEILNNYRKDQERYKKDYREFIKKAQFPFRTITPQGKKITVIGPGEGLSTGILYIDENGKKAESPAHSLGLITPINESGIGWEYPDGLLGRKMVIKRPGVQSEAAKYIVENEFHSLGFNPRRGSVFGPSRRQKKDKIVLPNGVDIELGTPEREARFKNARLEKEGWIPWMKRQIEEGIHNFTRKYPHITPEEFGDVINILNTHENTKQYSEEIAGRTISRILEKLSPQQFDVFVKSVALPDLLKDINNGKYQADENGEMKLPFGYRTKEDIESDIAKMKTIVGANPEIQEAMVKRKEFMDALRADLVENDILRPEVLDDDSYFHHQVLKHYNALESKTPGTGGRGIRTFKRGWARGRVGSELDYNTNYIESEFEWTAQAIRDLDTIETQKRIQSILDIKSDLARQVRAQNINLLNQKLNPDNDPLMDPLKPFKTRIAMSNSRLAKMAADGKLTSPNKGQFDDIVEALADSWHRYKASKADNPDNPEEWSRPGVNDPRWFPFLSALLDSNMDGSQWAATIFKTIRNRENFIKETLGKEFRTWKNSLPKGFTVWQPKQGNRLFIGNVLPDNILDKILQGNKEFDPALLKKMKIMGPPNEEWVIPEELAKEFDSLQNYREDSIIEKMANIGLSSWKQWTLLNPLRVWKYNFNNMSGDLDIALAYSPKILSYAPRALLDLIKYEISNKRNPDIEYAIKQGVINGGMTVSEIPDISNEGIFKALTQTETPFIKEVLSTLKKIFWDIPKKVTTGRENILRLAAFRYFKDHPNLLGASRAEEVTMIKDPAERAARVATDLLGNYGNISRAGQTIRKNLVPFWSWVEINFPRYVRIMRNSFLQRGRTGKVEKISAGEGTGNLAGHMAGSAILATMVTLWNKSMFPEEEKRLGKARNQLHIILGKSEDGNIRSVRFQGALSDALNWFGLDSPLQDIQDFSEGKQTLKDKISETVYDSGSKFINSALPFHKTFFETISGRSFYPNINRPTKIRDEKEHFARLLSVDPLYRMAAGKPNKGIMREVVKPMFGIYETDPGELAFNQINELVSKFQEKNNMARGGTGESTEKQDALYYYKKALRYKDKAAVKKYWAEYKKLGGSRESAQKSVEMGKPLGSLKEKDLPKFIRSLSPEERRLLSEARKWYSKTF